jgi:hypothetical protein
VGKLRCQHYKGTYLEGGPPLSRLYMVRRAEARKPASEIPCSTLPTPIPEIPTDLVWKIF